MPLHPYRETENEIRDEHREDARAAIEAMREPTDEMLDAGNVEGTIEPLGASETWELMIDAALASQ